MYTGIKASQWRILLSDDHMTLFLSLDDANHGVSPR